MIMDIKDAHKVIENLQTRPYICSENTIELDNGYVIVKKAYFKECQEAREKQTPKKPIHGGLYACPNCHTIMLQGAFEAKGKCCKECGQALDWSETV